MGTLQQVLETTCGADMYSFCISFALRCGRGARGFARVLRFALAIVVNASGRSAAGNASILASFWLVFVALIPAGVNLLASGLYPIPSRTTFVAAMRTENEAVRKLERT